MRIEISRDDETFSSQREVGVLYEDRHGDVWFELNKGTIVCLTSDDCPFSVTSWDRVESLFGPLRLFQGCGTLSND